MVVIIILPLYKWNWHSCYFDPKQRCSLHRLHECQCFCVYAHIFIIVNLLYLSILLYIHGQHYYPNDG